MFPSPNPILSLKMFVRVIVQISLARSFLAVQSACADSNFRQDIMLNMFVVDVCVLGWVSFPHYTNSRLQSETNLPRRTRIIIGG